MLLSGCESPTYKDWPSRTVYGKFGGLLKQILLIQMSFTLPEVPDPFRKIKSVSKTLNEERE